MENSPCDKLQTYNLGSFGFSFGLQWLAYFRLPPRELQKSGGSKLSFTGLAITPGCTSQVPVRNIRKNIKDAPQRRRAAVLLHIIETNFNVNMVKLEL